METVPQTDLNSDALELHRTLNGKISVESKAHLTPDTVPLLYTPGAGAVADYLALHPEETANLTIKGNSVAVISDGSAVLGMGNIGPDAALPVMEGKALLFRELGKLNAFPIVLDTQDPDEIVCTIKTIAPGFGGINLEDISAPRCYDIERRLQDALDIPVMHDDQHATAIVILAGLINACKVTNRDLKTAKVVILGAGAAGSAAARLLTHHGISDVVMVDSKGIVSSDRTNLDENKRDLAEITNPRKLSGDVNIALKDADVMVGVSKCCWISPAQIQTMAKDPIVFALANPDPEIMPDSALKAGAAVVATGSSHWPNQINNVLVFPGFFQGAIKNGVKKITDNMKIRAAYALASLVEQPSPDQIIPSMFDARVVPAVAKVVTPD